MSACEDHLSLLVITVPDQMAKASNLPLDHFQSCSVPRVEGMDATDGLLNVLHAHGDVPPIPNSGDGHAHGGANQAGKRGFTVANGRDGAGGRPSLITKGLAQCRQWGLAP